ncbi:Cation-transporting ATPase [Minicystis rosea]|nr:Cation-transporting ATPase [Minicystis rosea]
MFDLGAWLYGGGRGWPIEALAIAAVLVLNAALGVIQEYRSENALARLKTLAAPVAWALRDGRLVHIPSSQLVPGDVVRVEAGERIPADGTLLDGLGVMIDESVLTGESVPVDRPVGAEVYSGTLLVRGAGFLRVTGTGVRSTMGRLAAMLGRIQTDKTPLERRLDVLGGKITRWVAALAALLIVLGLLAEGPAHVVEVVIFAVALAVAAVPEGMPAVVTATLALGVQHMARRHAVVRRLAAVEALGSVTVIATDKTGTLTENRMSVAALESDDPEAALTALVLANDADAQAAAGDPLELGLIEHARSRGLDPLAIRRAHPRLASRPFDSAWKFMRVTVASPSGAVSFLKGAPEVLLARAALSPEGRARWLERAQAGAAQGYRVLGLARAPSEQEEALELLGLVMLWDPPRAEVTEAIRKVQDAGVRVLMITGDHPATARAVAEAIGITSTEVLAGADIEHLTAEELQRAVRRIGVFARMSPEHKLRLVEALKADGHIVAVTGDGVNDAPALKRSDVGIAMGQRGSDVAREVADLVLLDDNFASIVGAIEEGRGIHENIQKFIRYTFSTNVALVLLVVTGLISAYALGLRDAAGMLLLPLTAFQLLWINMVGDGPPALALALDRNPDVMSRPPRPPTSALLDGPSSAFIVATGALKGFIGILLLMLVPRWGYGPVAIQSLLFLYESIAKLVSAYPSRRLVHPSRHNLALHLSIGVGIGLQLLTILVPALRRVLGLERLDVRAMITLAIAVGATWVAAELVNRLIRLRLAAGRVLREAT